MSRYTAAIHLQAKNMSAAIIKNKEYIKFDTIITQSQYGFYYNIDTGDLWIMITGYYFVEWNISLGGTSNVEDISLTLKNEYWNDGIEITSPVILSNQITGCAILPVRRINQRYYLINTSCGDLQYAKTGVQVNFVMYKIS